MKEKELAALAHIARALNAADVTWAVGASLLLWRCGITQDFHDIDLLVAEADIRAAVRALDGIGRMTNCKRSAPFTTEYFYEYTIDGAEVDVMARFGVELDGVRYDYGFGADNVAAREDVGGEPVPFGFVEDWYVLYQLIPGREAKVRMTEDYLARPGRADRAALTRALENPLPDGVRARTRALLDAQRS